MEDDYDIGLEDDVIESIERDEYSEPQDIDSTLAQLKEAWSCVPDVEFGVFLDEALNGYHPKQLTPGDMEQMLNEYIHTHK